MGIREFVIGKFLNKLLKQGVQIAVSWIVGQNLGQFGVTIDPVTLSAGIWTGLETVRSLAKHKYGINWL